MELSTYLQNLVMLIGLGIAIDYSLLIVYRYREELRRGLRARTRSCGRWRPPGRAVVFSGTAVAIGLALMLLMPLPFIRGFGIGGADHPAVSVLCALTLLPVLLYFLATARPRPPDPETGDRAPRAEQLLGAALALDHAPARCSWPRHHGALLIALRSRCSRSSSARARTGHPAGPRGRAGAEHHRGGGRRGSDLSDGDRDRHRAAGRGPRPEGHVRRWIGALLVADPEVARLAFDPSNRGLGRPTGPLPEHPGRRRERVRRPGVIDFVDRLRDDDRPERRLPRGSWRSTPAAGRPAAATSSTSRTARSPGWCSACSC